MNIKDIFYDLIKEASCGCINIDGDIWSIGFNSIIYDKEIIKHSFCKDDFFPTLTIKNEDEFFHLLEQYVNLELSKNRKTITYTSSKELNHIKTIISYLFANATPSDFTNPNELIIRNINFLNDDTFKSFNNGVSIDLKDMFYGSNLIIRNTSQSLFMETPNKMEFSLHKKDGDDKDVFLLPTISYGISKDECYIYSIMNPKVKDANKSNYAKKVSRILYKINDGVKQTESKEYLDYINGISDYYPENISDVSPSFVLSLSIFLSILQTKGIKTVKVVPYLPIRYLSRDISSEKIMDNSIKEELKERNDSIQQNATDKFIRTFRRVEYHMENVNIISDPDSSYFSISLSCNNKDINNPILNDVSSKINKH